MAVRTGVIYLQKDRFQMFSPFLGSIVEFRFAPQIVRDLDVLDSDQLESQIKTFVTNGKIPPSNLIIVLCDNAYFVKDFVLPNPSAQKPGQPSTPQPKVSLKDLQPQIDLFIEHVPYENVVSKTFPLKNGLRVCAVNQDFYGGIQTAFEKLGFIVEAVLPGMVLGNGLSAKPVMDGGMVNFVLQKTPSLKQYDLKSQAAFVPAKKEKETNAVDEVQEAMESSKEPPKTNKKRMILMVAVLAILLVVLVIVYMQSLQPPPPPPQPTLAQQQSVAPPVATVSTDTPVVATLNPDITNALEVQIINTSASTSAAQSLRTALNTFKFKKVTLQTQSSTNTSTTIVSFSSNVNQEIRNKVLDEVKKVKTEVTVQERNEGTNEISILLGK